MPKARFIRLEAASICQLRCPSCPTTQGIVKRHVGSGFLRFEDFCRLVDNNSFVAHIELSNWGEIFLNPDLLRILEYAYKKNVALSAVNGVNLNTVREDVLEALVRYKFREMTCSIDGASEETYQIYRKRGQLSSVLDNIQKLKEYKRKYHSQFPRLTWQFIVFGHNEHEIPKAKQMADELGMKMFFKLSWDENFSPPVDADFVMKETGLTASSRSDYHRKHKRRYGQRKICTQLWKGPQINWDGQVLGCCVNTWGDFGRVSERWDLSSVLDGDKVNYAKQMLLGKKSGRDDIPCTACSYYRSMQADGNWLTKSETENWRELFGSVRYSRAMVWFQNQIDNGRSVFAGLAQRMGR